MQQIKKLTLHSIRYIPILILLILSIVFTRSYVSFQQFQHTTLIPCGAGFDYRLTPGASLKKLAHDLTELGVLTHPSWFVWTGYLHGQSRKLKAGHYHFFGGSTPKDILQQLVAGRVVQYRLTVVEGWTFRQLLTAIQNETHLIRHLTGLSDKLIMKELNAANKKPEGLFYPDTYIFTDETTDVVFLKRAYDAMQSKLNNEWKNRDVDLLFKNPYEALIAASLIEKETALDEERPLIAAVILNRLRKNMRLQFDPTVLYGLNKTKISTKDLHHKTPHNTYTRKGLPPTPIALPGLKSLHAALHPAKTSYLYFVAKGDGTHKFSKTLREQRRAVNKYQRSGKKA